MLKIKFFRHVVRVVKNEMNLKGNDIFNTQLRLETLFLISQCQACECLAYIKMIDGQTAGSPNE